MDRAARARTLETLAVAAAAAAFLHLVTFRDGTFVYLFHKATTGPFLDEGARVAAGEVPWRDFAARATPGILYMNGAIVRLFGQSLAAMAWAGIATGCALAAALHALSAAVVRGAWRFAPAAVLVLLVYPPADIGGHKWPALLLVLLAARALVAHPPPLAALLAAGAACGLAALFSPVPGLAGLAGLALHLGLERAPRTSRTLLLLAGGALLPVLAFLLAAPGATGPVLRGWWAAGLPDLRTADPLGRWRPFDLACLLAVAAGVLAGVRALRGGAREDDPAERMTGRAGLVLLASAAAGHIEPYAFAASGLIIFVAAAAAASRPARNVAARRARFATAVMLAVLVAYCGAALVAWRQWAQPVVRQQFRAGAAWLGAPNEELAWLESRADAGEPVFVFPAGGASYFLTWTRNATSFSYMIEGLTGEADQRAALSQLDARRPAVGLWMGRQRFARPPGRPTLDVLGAGVLSRYAVERTLADGTLLLRRKDLPPPP